MGGDFHIFMSCPFYPKTRFRNLWSRRLPYTFFILRKALTGMCPANPALQDGAKGHNIKEKYLTGKPPPFSGRGASIHFLDKLFCIQYTFMEGFQKNGF
jgi:hypothetical protein